MGIGREARGETGWKGDIQPKPLTVPIIHPKPETLRVWGRFIIPT